MIGRLQAHLVTHHDRARSIEPFGCPLAEQVAGTPACARWGDDRFRDTTCPHLESITHPSNPAWRTTLLDITIDADSRGKQYHRIGILCAACKVAAPPGA